jgi:hypothetical protein
MLFLSLLPIRAADDGEKSEMVKKQPYRVPYVSYTIEVDAHLNENTWQKALQFEPRYEVRPGENIPAPVKTEVFFAYNETHLFVAFKAFDPDPSQIRAHITDRDDMWSDDWVLILFDTFNDNRRMYDFACNPFGIQGDMIESSSGEGDDWDAIWESDGRITDEGYIVEMAIPFSSLRFQHTEKDQIWGFDAIRSYPRRVRHHIGSFPRDRNNNCYMCQSEKLIGFADVKPGKNLEFDPTLSAIASQERDDSQNGKFIYQKKNIDPGLTTKWGITPNINLIGTLNPDFSQVEADAAQLDINTQFALFYPEKRPFFVQGSEIFITRLNTVHTRTVADPDWGAKVIGQEQAHSFGLFSAGDRITNLLIPGSQGSQDTSLSQNAYGTVMRYRYDLGRASNLGLIFTDREGEHYFNRLAGFDGMYKFTLKDQLNFQFIGSQTRYPEQIIKNFEQPQGAFKGAGGDLFYLHDSKTLDWYARARQMSPDLRADLGFISQVGYRYYDVGAAYTWRRNPGHWYTLLNLGVGFEEKQDYAGNSLLKSLDIWFDYQGPLESYFDGYINIGDTYYNGQIFRDNFIQFLSLMRPSGMLTFEFDGILGDGIDYDNTQQGQRYNIEPEIGLKLWNHLTLEAEHTFEYFKIHAGRLYTANISHLRCIYQFNRRTFLRVLLQSVHYNRNQSLYLDAVDKTSRHLFSQILFSYKINPQTVLFLGYSDNYNGSQTLNLRQTDRTVFTKLGYAWVL